MPRSWRGLARPASSRRYIKGAGGDGVGVASAATCLSEENARSVQSMIAPAVISDFANTLVLFSAAPRLTRPGIVDEPGPEQIIRRRLSLASVAMTHSPPRFFI